MDRHTLRIGAVRSRLIAIAAVLATVPIGTALNAAALLAAVVAVAVAMLVPERGHPMLTADEPNQA